MFAHRSTVFLVTHLFYKVRISDLNSVQSVLKKKLFLSKLKPFILNMSAIRREEVNFAINRVYNLTDHNIHNNFHKRHEFQQQTIRADNSLTEDEKAEAIKVLNKIYDSNKILLNKGTRRICENCNQECLAT